jgi:thiamine biosynthesis lipoprotein
LFEAVEPHMGTLVRIKLYAAGVEQARDAFRAAFGLIAGIDAALSDYKPESEVSRLSRAAAGEPVPVSEDLFRVLSVAQELAASTDGAFDVTLGPVTRLWREARKRGEPPDARALREASAVSGYRKLRLNERFRTVTLEKAGMQLDLGGIAKGYAADAALGVLRESGIRSALVAVSGDVACSGPPPGKRGWRIAAGPLPEDSSARLPVLVLSNAAVSTSGDAEQYLDFGGRRYSHIVDPQSGEGLTRRIGVTVVASSGIRADGLATAVSVLGAERGIALIEESSDAAAWIAISQGGPPRLIESERFGRLTENREPATADSGGGRPSSPNKD